MNPTESLLITVIEFRRSPVEFRQALWEDESLAECRLQLAAADQSTELDTGAKVFLEPQHVLPTLEHLRSQGVLLNGVPTYLGDLKFRHVIVSERYISDVRAALDALPKRLNVKEKFTSSFQVGLGVHWPPAVDLETGHGPPQGGSLASILQVFARTLDREPMQWQ